jgi:hypothetical protein
MLLLQFAFICHSLLHIAEKLLISKDSKALDKSLAGLAFSGQGTLRLVNFLIHCFGVFDFLGFDNAPNTRVAKYREKKYQGLYPQLRQAP